MVESKRSNADREGPTGERGERMRGGSEDQTGPKGKEKRRETDQISRAKALITAIRVWRERKERGGRGGVGEAYFSLAKALHAKYRASRNCHAQSLPRLGYCNARNIGLKCLD